MCRCALSRGDEEDVVTVVGSPDDRPEVGGKTVEAG
jgi:hypothetical protein